MTENARTPSAVRLSQLPAELAELPFSEAANIWFGIHARQHGIAPSSADHYRKCIKALTRFFSQLRLSEIHVGHFDTYQQERSQDVGPSRVNHELNTLSQILKRAALWSKIKDFYQPMSLPKPNVGCALTPAQEEKLFSVASTKSRWKVAYLCSIITANTTAGPGEILGLRLRDINLQADPPMIHVSDGAKNIYRVRDIPLNEAAAFAIGALLARAEKMGCTDPSHYLLPHRSKGPATHMTTWNTAWMALRKAAGMPKLRMYDLRHHAITRLLETENVSERTVTDIAGHVSRQMLNRYSHIRMGAKKDAVDALGGIGGIGSNAIKSAAREDALKQLEILQKRIANEPTEQVRKAASAILALLDGNDPGETG